MKRLHSVLLTACLLVSPLLFSVSWGQTKPQSVTFVETPSIEGYVVDAATKQPIANADIQAKNQAGKVVARQRVGANGAYQLRLDDPKQAYLLIVNVGGYEPYEERVAFTTSNNTKILGKALRLYRAGTKPTATQTGATVPQTASAVSLATVTGTAPATPPVSATLTGRQLAPPKTLDAKVTNAPPLIVAPAGRTTQLRAIQFVQSKAELLPDAQPALEQLLTFMRDKPTIEIELAGHTDNQGDFDENVRLSKQRVELVKAYLVQNGIAAGRITTRGYGPTRPLATNNNEGSRQQNRRVEMKVVNE